jgi:signal transduction histidine kinase
MFLPTRPFLRSLCLGHWLVMTLLGWLLLSGHVHAKDHITQRAWLDDPGAQLSWPEVQSQPFQPFQGMLSQGFGDSVIWLKLRIDPDAFRPSQQDSDRLVLRIRPVYLDDIRIYDPLSSLGLVGQTGDLHHPRLEEFQGLDMMLPIARGKQARDIWVRMASKSTRQIDIQALNVDDLSPRILKQSLVFSVYLGLVALLAVWGLVYGAFSREALIGAFGIKQVFALLFAIASLGHLRAFWPENWPAWLVNELTIFFSIFAVSSAVLFHVLLIREFKPPRWIQLMLWAMLALLPLKLLILAFGWTTLALQVNMKEVLLAPLIFLVSVFLSKGWDQGSPQRPALSKPVVVGFYVIMTSFLLMAALPALGWISGTEIGLYIVQVHGLLTAFLILLLLQYRAHVLNKIQRENAITLERTLLQSQQDRLVLKEQEKLLTMLAHELKTPLATMTMRLDANASGSPQIRQAIREMNGVIERCVQITQLGDRRLVACPAPLDLLNTVTQAIAASTQPQRIQLQASGPIPAQTDSQLAFIVLNNLIENACKYAAPDTPIQVNVQVPMQAKPSFARIEIINSPGPAGWPDADKLFEKYYRSPHARRQAGTGLGLFLARNLTQVLGWNLDYAPHEGCIRFVVQIPLEMVITGPDIPKAHLG